MSVAIVKRFLIRWTINGYDDNQTGNTAYIELPELTLIYLTEVQDYGIHFVFILTVQGPGDTIKI